MVRTLPTGLAALVSASGQQPTVQVTIQDFANRYSLFASGGSAGRSAALLTSAGTILRATVTQGTPAQNILVLRVPTPANAGGWVSPATVGTAVADARAGCCLAQTGSAIRLFYQDFASRKIVTRDSTDDGVTWGAPVSTLPADPQAIGHYVWGICADGINQVWIQSSAYPAISVASALYASSYSSGWSAWTSVGPAQPRWGALRGIGCVNNAGSRKFVAGVSMRSAIKGIATATCTWNGSAFTDFVQIVGMDHPDLGLDLANPSLSFDGTTYYLTVMETDDGSGSGSAQTRTTVYTSTDFVNWAPWQSLGPVFQFGAWTIQTGGVVYIFDSTHVYLASAAPAPVDVSDDLLSLTIDETLSTHGVGQLVLSNTNGQYNNHPSVRADARVQVTLGYGAYSVLTHTLLIDSVTYEATDASINVVLHMRDASKLLDYQQGKLITNSALTIGALIQYIGRQAGISVGPLPATTQFTTPIPCFMISPGETWLQALHHLSLVFGFEWFADETSTLQIREPAAGDASVWTYTTEMLMLNWSSAADQANVIKVVGVDSTGKPVFSQAVDGANILATGKERYMHVVERSLDTAAKCKIKAQLALREEQMDAMHHRLHVAMNPALQVNDVVTYTDTVLGLSGQTARIQRLQLTIHPNAGEWSHHIECGGV